jgi:hypothetical protein
MESNDDDDVSFIEIYVKLRNTIVFLWSKRYIIILAGLVGAITGLTVSYLKAPKYESKLTFVGEDASGGSNIGALASLASSFGIGGLSTGGGLYGDANLMSYLKTKSIIEETLLAQIPGIKKTFAQEFIEVYEWNKDWEDDSVLVNMSFPINDNREKFSIQKDSILKEIYLYLVEDNEYINVLKPNEEATIIEVSVISKSQLFSKHFPEELLKNVSEKYIKDKTQQARYTVDVIQKQADSVRKVLNNSLLKSASVTDQVFGLNPALNIQRVSASKEQVDIQVSSAVLEELIKNLELSKMSLLHQTPLIEIIDRPRFPLEVIEIKKIVGVLVGGLLFGFLMICYLLVSNFLKNIKAQSP